MDRRTALKLARMDRTLGRLIQTVHQKMDPIALVPQARQSPYQALVESVVYQQLTGKAAATILARVVGLFPKRRFPKPEDILATPDELLRSAGLSRAKALAIKDIAAKTLEGVVPTSRGISRLEDGEILSRLTSIRGVGPWTVEMLLIFKLGRPDILPVTDYGVRKGFALAYRKRELPTPRQLMEYGTRWQPYRTTAAWYLWRAADLGKKAFAPSRSSDSR